MRFSQPTVDVTVDGMRHVMRVRSTQLRKMSRDSEECRTPVSDAIREPYCNICSLARVPTILSAMLVKRKSLTRELEAGQRTVHVSVDVDRMKCCRF